MVLRVNKQTSHTYEPLSEPYVGSKIGEVSSYNLRKEESVYDAKSDCILELARDEAFQCN